MDFFNKLLHNMMSVCKSLHILLKRKQDSVYINPCLKVTSFHSYSKMNENDWGDSLLLTEVKVKKE